MLLELIRAFCSIVGLHKGEFLGSPLVAFVVNLAKVKHTSLWHTLLSHCFPYFYLDQSVPSYCCHDVFFPRKALTDHWLVDNFGIITCDCLVSRLQRGACIYFGLCSWQSQDRNFTCNCDIEKFGRENSQLADPGWISPVCFFLIFRPAQRIIFPKLRYSIMIKIRMWL